MQKFNSLTSIPAYLPIVNIDTDMIIPKQFLKTIKRTGLGKNLFFEMRYDDNGNEIKDFIRKPCIRNIKHISFDKKIHVNDTAGRVSIEKLSLIDKGTAITPHFLPVCRIYLNSKS